LETGIPNREYRTGSDLPALENKVANIDIQWISSLSERKTCVMLRVIDIGISRTVDLSIQYGGCGDVDATWWWLGVD